MLSEDKVDVEGLRDAIRVLTPAFQTWIGAVLDELAALRKRLAERHVPSNSLYWEYWGEVAHEIFPTGAGARIGRCTSEESAKEIIAAHNDAMCAALRAQADAQPVDMLLHCPNCGLQHIDEPEELPVPIPGGMCEGSAGWSNPPHRSHLCHGCGHIWRPADVATNGVAKLKTKGKNDSPAPEAAQALSDGEILDAARREGVQASAGVIRLVRAILTHSAATKAHEAIAQLNRERAVDPAMLNMLLDAALRSAATVAEPVEAIDPGECAKDVFERGQSLGYFDIPKDAANIGCALASSLTGDRFDWHYFAGRVHVKVLKAAQQQAEPIGEVDAAMLDKWRAKQAEPSETGGYVTHDQAFKNAVVYEQSRPNHQGAPEASRDDASGIGAPLESGAHQHHQHRSGEADADQQEHHGDSRGAGVRGARELSPAETVAAQQQAEPVGDECVAFEAWLAAHEYPITWRERGAFFAGYRAVQSGQRAGVAPIYKIVAHYEDPRKFSEVLCIQAVNHVAAYGVEIHVAAPTQQQERSE